MYFSCSYFKLSGRFFKIQGCSIASAGFILFFGSHWRHFLKKSYKSDSKLEGNSHSLYGTLSLESYVKYMFVLCPVFKKSLGGIPSISI
jgi:hypothetical protein